MDLHLEKQGRVSGVLFCFVLFVKQDLDAQRKLDAREAVDA